MTNLFRSSRAKRLPFLLLTLLLATAAGKRPTPEPPPPVGVTVTRSAGARVVRAVLPGTVSAVELPRLADGRLALVVLLGSESRTLHRVDLDETAGDDALTPLLKDLPKGSLGALDLDGDGAEELLIAADGTLRSLGAVASPRPPASLLDTVGTEVLLPSRWSERSLDGVVVASVGRARLFVPSAGRLTASLDLPVPTRASRQPHGIRLSSPRILTVAGDSARLAAAPQAIGKQRLRTLLLEAGASTEAWSLLPAPEDVNEARYATIDGRPSLIVTTTNADKLGIFEGKKLRVFALAADRTQAGRAPILAAQTTSHRWFPVETTIADVDRDGHDDVIVLQSDGMGGGETIVETFFGRGDGGFSTPGRRQKWELRSGGWSYGADLTGDGAGGFSTPGRRQKWELRSGGWSYGADLTGDGVADLAVLDDEALNVFAGTPDPRRALLAREPIRVPIALGSDRDDSRRALRVADLDHDGKSEAILLGRVAEDRDAVFVVSLDRAAGAPRAATAPPVSAARGN